MVNEVQAILRQLEANTQVAPAGFANLSQGLAAVIDRQQETSSLLDRNGAQNETIVGWLAVIAELAGRQLGLLQQQVELERSIAPSIHRSLRIAELAHPSEALEVDRSAAAESDDGRAVKQALGESGAGEKQGEHGAGAAPAAVTGSSHDTEPRHAAYQRKIPSFTPLSPLDSQAR
jgi:hypothetical protein